MEIAVRVPLVGWVYLPVLAACLCCDNTLQSFSLKIANLVGTRCEEAHVEHQPTYFRRKRYLRAPCKRL